MKDALKLESQLKEEQGSEEHGPSRAEDVIPLRHKGMSTGQFDAKGKSTIIFSVKMDYLLLVRC